MIHYYKLDITFVGTQKAKRPLMWGEVRLNQIMQGEVRENQIMAASHIA